MVGGAVAALHRTGAQAISAPGAHQALLLHVAIPARLNAEICSLVTQREAGPFLRRWAPGLRAGPQFEEMDEMGPSNSALVDVWTEDPALLDFPLSWH